MGHHELPLYEEGQFHCNYYVIHVNYYKAFRVYDNKR